MEPNTQNSSQADSEHGLVVRVKVKTLKHAMDDETIPNDPKRIRRGLMSKIKSDNLAEEMRAAGVSNVRELCRELRRNGPGVPAAMLKHWWQYIGGIKEARAKLAEWRQRMGMGGRVVAPNAGGFGLAHNAHEQLTRERLGLAHSLALEQVQLAGGSIALVCRTVDLDWSKRDACIRYHYPTKTVVYDVMTMRPGWDIAPTAADAYAWATGCTPCPKSCSVWRMRAPEYRVWKRSPTSGPSPDLSLGRLQLPHPEQVLNQVLAIGDPARRSKAVKALPLPLRIEAIAKLL